MGIFSNHEKHEKAYGEGVKDAEKAGFLDVIVHEFGDTIGTVVPSSSENKSYEKGWHDQISGKK